MSEEIFDEFGDSATHKHHRISKDRVVAWATSDDLEVQGALYLCLSDPSKRLRVMPEMNETEFVELALRYFDRCIQVDRQGDFAHGRYEAGWDIVGIFRNVWATYSINPSPAEKIKAFLAVKYFHGDEPVRNFVVTAVLEHLFEVPDIANYFKDWRTSESLRTAYNEAEGFANQVRDPSSY